MKAFNIEGNAHFIHPEFPCGPPDMWIAGNDDEAKKMVTSFLRQLGWYVIDTGGIEGARLLEPMCILWVNYATRGGTWDHAFKMHGK